MDTSPPHPNLVKIYLLRMRLPSKYLVQRVRVEESERGVKEIRDFSDSTIRAAVASRLEGIRRKVYEMIEDHFVHLDSLGIWIAISEEAVKRTEEIDKWIKEQLNAMPALKQLRESLPKYFVKAIPIYLKPDDAKQLLLEACKVLESELEELRKRIDEAKKEGRRSLKRLKQRFEYKHRLLTSFEQYIKTLFPSIFN